MRISVTRSTGPNARDLPGIRAEIFFVHGQDVKVVNLLVQVFFWTIASGEKTDVTRRHEEQKVSFHAALRYLIRFQL